MISYIKGTVQYIGEDFIILESNNIGYNVQVSAKTSAALSGRRDTVKLFTFLNLSSVANSIEINLFGFMSMQELNMFTLLKSVSGVGPKAALAMLSTLTVQKLALAIITSDYKTLSLSQGIGKKTAERIALELKDKIKTEDAMNLTDIPDYSDVAAVEDEDSLSSEAAEALMTLGFSKSEAISAVASVDTENKSAEEIIQLALTALRK